MPRLKLDSQPKGRYGTGRMGNEQPHGLSTILAMMNLLGLS
ncbi:MAG: hypothetical protein ACOX20_10720 [Limnochordia bacterium]